MLPSGSAKWKRRPPGKSNVSRTTLPPHAARARHLLRRLYRAAPSVQDPCPWSCGTVTVTTALDERGSLSLQEISTEYTRPSPPPLRDASNSTLWASTTADESGVLLMPPPESAAVTLREQTGSASQLSLTE